MNSDNGLTVARFSPRVIKHTSRNLLLLLLLLSLAPFFFFYFAILHR